MFDHTSIIRFLELFTGVHEPNISAWRRQVSGDLTSAFDFAHPDYSVPTLPSVSTISCSGSTPSVPGTQTNPSQESRQSRQRSALPYQPNATSRTDCAAGRFYINLTRIAGTASAHFAICPNAYRTDGPWQYDVAAGGSLEDYFSVQTYGAVKYDLTVYGPNGFRRVFAGNINTACGQLEVTPTLHPASSTLDLTYVNNTASSVTFTTTANAYRTGGPWTYTVAAGASVTATWDVGTAGSGWYDLTTTVNADTLFRRRLVGHVETGAPSITGTYPSSGGGGTAPNLVVNGDSESSMTAWTRDVGYMQSITASQNGNTPAYDEYAVLLRRGLRGNRELGHRLDVPGRERRGLRDADRSGDGAGADLGSDANVGRARPTRPRSGSSS